MIQRLTAETEGTKRDIQKLKREGNERVGNLET